MGSDIRTDFIEALASNSPSPGGGGAAALMGALGAALCSMAANLTVGRKKYAGAETELRGILAECERLSARFVALIDEDAAAFAPLAAAYSMDKSAPGYAKTMREASLRACMAPVEMLECCAVTVSLLEKMLDIGNPMLKSDVGCGAAACAAAMKSAAMNVYVNTRALSSDPQARAINAKVAGILKHSLPRAEELAEEVLKDLER